MLKEIRFINWKSFGNATLYIDPLTVLIGTNASGKSNTLDGIAFINRVAQGKDLSEALMGASTIMFDDKLNAIRGGTDWAAKKPGSQFKIEALIEKSENLEYKYSIEIRTAPQLELVSESLMKITYTKRRKERDIPLFTAYEEITDSIGIPVELYNGQGRQKKKQFKKSLSIISQIRNQELHKEVETGVEFVIEVLEKIFILDPVPSLMRDYRPFSSNLLSNASNLAGVLAALPPMEKDRIERQLLEYISKLPERDIEKVWAEPVGIFKKDAMIYCQEEWIKGEKLTVDARGMSDGTLRFLGILTGLLTRPEGTLIVIEEVDNGLHPSRAKLLLEMLREIGSQRKIDILVTTHNPALMDELGKDMIPFIIIANRSSDTGESILTLLEDVNNLPKLLASGSLGKLATKGIIEDILNESGDNKGEH